jgi:predicted glycoside hydrolase/deacetylase ChbG (UPF0249 family)
MSAASKLIVNADDFGIAEAVKEIRAAMDQARGQS